MPKLMILTACERVIIDKVASLPSLINIFQKMNVQLQDAPLAENAVAPIRWAVFTLWAHTQDEVGKEFTQRTEILSPSGNRFGEGTAKFMITETNDLQSKHHLDILGLPIESEGFVTVRVWLEGIPDSATEYKFAVKHLPKKS